MNSDSKSGISFHKKILLFFKKMKNKRYVKIEKKVDALSKLVSEMIQQNIIAHECVDKKLKGIERNAGEAFERYLHALLVRDIHLSVFPPYKDIYRGRDVVIVGAGPTLANYQPIPNAIHIGVNRTFRYDKVSLDFLFAQDFPALKSYIDEIVEYRRGVCQKFFGIYPNSFRKENIPDKYAIAASAKRYIVASGLAPYKFFCDISRYPLADAGSVAFAAANFAIYTSPSRLYLVGLDCDIEGYFTGESQYPPDAAGRIARGKKRASELIRGWSCFKSFCDVFYPETKVICINPIGLKGIFTEIREEDGL